jgi:hypothetical protein
MKDFLEEMDEKDRKFDDAIKWLAEQRKPAGMRDKDIATGPGQKAFFEGDHRCSGCHKAEFTEKKDKTLTFTKKGGASAPDLSGYGSEEWIRGMIMSPGHKSRHKTNFMPAFRDLDGPNAAVNIQEARELNKDTSISHLTDVERELIIRWMLRDYRPVFGGAAIAK